MALDPADVKGLGRPSEFKGDEEHWSEWSLAIRAYISCMGDYSEEMIDAAEHAGVDLTVDRLRAVLGEEAVRTNRKIYYALSMSTKATAHLRGPYAHIPFLNLRYIN